MPAFNTPPQNTITVTVPVPSPVPTSNKTAIPRKVQAGTAGAGGIGAAGAGAGAAGAGATSIPGVSYRPTAAMQGYADGHASLSSRNRVAGGAWSSVGDNSSDDDEDKNKGGWTIVMPHSGYGFVKQERPAQKFSRPGAKLKPKRYAGIDPDYERQLHQGMSLGDHDSHLMYADHLEENGHPAIAAFIRKAVDDSTPVTNRAFGSALGSRGNDRFFVEMSRPFVYKKSGSGYSVYPHSISLRKPSKSGENVPVDHIWYDRDIENNPYGMISRLSSIINDPLVDFGIEKRHRRLFTGSSQVPVQSHQSIFHTSKNVGGYTSVASQLAKMAASYFDSDPRRYVLREALRGNPEAIRLAGQMLKMKGEPEADLYNFDALADLVEKSGPGWLDPKEVRKVFFKPNPNRQRRYARYPDSLTALADRIESSGHTNAHSLSPTDPTHQTLYSIYSRSPDHHIGHVIDRRSGRPIARYVSGSGPNASAHLAAMHHNTLLSLARRAADRAGHSEISRDTWNHPANSDLRTEAQSHLHSLSKLLPHDTPTHHVAGTGLSIERSQSQAGEHPDQMSASAKSPSGGIIVREGTKSNIPGQLYHGGQYYQGGRFVPRIGVNKKLVAPAAAAV